MCGVSVVVVVVAVALVVNMNDYWKDFAAGYAGGLAGIAAGHPIDTVRVRIQTCTSQSIGATFQSIIQFEGVKSLYKGLVAPAVGVGALNAVLFGTFASSYKTIDQWIPNHHFANTYLSGCIAGLGQTIVATPIELVKIQRQMVRDREMKGLLPLLKRMYHKGGITSLWYGASATAVRDIPSYGTYFLSYEWLKRQIQKSDSTFWRPDDPHVQLAIAGGFAGVIAWFSCYPFELIKTRIQAQGHAKWQVGDKDRYRGILDCARKSYQREGSQVFVRGLGATLLRAIPVNAVTFVVYEYCMDQMNKWE